MSVKHIDILSKWIEKKYATGTRSEYRNNTMVLLKELVFSDGIALYTDGIKEVNTEFDGITITGYNYAMLCLFGKEYSDVNNRILIYCNRNSKWGYFKYLKVLCNILNSYKK
jgi:hypothetical protein